MSIDPNSGILSSEDFARIERPLIRIDEILQQFATKTGGIIWKNYHGRPARDVVLDSPDGITRRIGIASVLRHPAMNPQPTPITMDYVVGIYAYRKSTLPEGLWVEHVATFRRLPSTSARTNKLLQECWKRLKRISASQL